VTSGTTVVMSGFATSLMPAGVTIAPGDVMTFTATGTYGDLAQPGYTPKSVGCKVVASGGTWAPKLTAWAIIGQVGGSVDGGVPFCIGASVEVTAKKAGSLLLGINGLFADPVPSHYVGFATVKWTVSHQP
jgi:hypothetical protein